MDTSIFDFSVSSFHVVCAPSVREMKHVCPLNVSNIELYLYIIYMLISFLYPYRPMSMCYTQVLYSNIYIAFFLWEKKIIKWFLLNHWWSLLCQGMGGQDGVPGPPAGGGQALSGDALGSPRSSGPPHLWWCGSPRSSPGVHCCSPFPSTGGLRSRPGLPACDGGTGMGGGG